MYRSKREVDKHVSDILSKVQNENERNQKGFPIAKLYFQVKDYEMSKRYLAGYLSVKDTHAAAHKLMGQVMEALGNKESALQSYKRSLELDLTQKDILLKICELYCDMAVDPDTARYWASRAEKVHGHHNTIFRLRECIVNAEGEPDVNELERLITSELDSCPKDVTLYTKLLKLYTDTERVEEAYRYAAKVELKKPFRNSIDWCYCLADIFEAYQEEKSQLQLSFCLEYLEVLDHLCTLLLAEPHAMSDQDITPTKHSRSVADAASVLHTFDKFLQRASQQSFSQEPSWMYMKHQMQGQLYLHLGTLLLKRAKKERANWKEACRYASALYLMAYTFKHGSLQLEAWFCKMEGNKQIFLDAQQKGILRLSYVGHVLWSLCSSKEDRLRWVLKVKQETCTQPVQVKIFQRCFGSLSVPRQQQQQSSKQSGQSFFLQDPAFLNASLEFPTEASLYEYDKVSHKVYPGSLHHLVWLSIQWLPVKKFSKKPTFQVFEKLQMSNALLNSGSPESLCQLDVDAFLSATVFSAWAALEERGRIGVPIKGFSTQAMILSVVPDICDPLCTPEQASWWKAAYALHSSQAKEKLGEMRQILTRGLETIRGVGAHGMDVALLVHLARHFSKQAETLRQTVGEDTPSEEVSALADRASHYWSLLLESLDRLQGRHSAQISLSSLHSQSPSSLKSQPLFPSFHPEPSVQETIVLMEEAQYYLACRLMATGQLAEAAQAFSKLTTADALHNHATVLVKLSQQPGQNKDARLGLLVRARDSLYLTLDKISGNKQHPLNLLLHEEIEAVELKLATQSHNDGQSGRASEASVEDEDIIPLSSLSLNGNSPRLARNSQNNGLNRSSNVGNNSLREILELPTIPQQASLNGSFHVGLPASNITREHLRPSPERLNSQIRALSFNQVGVLQLLLEQQQTLMESVKSIVEDLKDNKSLIEELKKTVSEVQNTKCNHPSHLPPSTRSSISQPMQRQMSQRIRNMRLAQPHEEETEEFGVGRHPDPAQLYEYAIEAEEGGFEYGGYLHDPRNAHGMGYPMMMHYPSHYPQPPPHYPQPPPPHYPQAPAHYPQPSPHMGPPMAPHLPPSLSQRPPPPRTCYPNYGTALTFNEGQQLPHFNFRMPLSSPALPVQSINTVENRASVFSRLGPPQSGFVPPPPTPMWEHQTSQPAPFPEARDMSWHDKGASNAPHAFQIPLPTTSFPSSQPPSILTTTQPAFVSPQVTPVSESGVTPTTPVFTPGGIQQSAETFKGFLTPGNISSSSGVGVATPPSGKKDLASDSEDVDFDFKPAIPLPDEVDVCTGEEHENVLFEERAKLFRFVDKEWKERGVGVLKILVDKNSDKIRLLMRRDQVLKVCANHHIVAGMQLSPMKDSDRAWIWAAQDYAEEKLKSEQFCIRFKNKDLAQNFKKVFESAVEKVSKQVKSVAPVNTVDAVKPFGDKFKPAAGSWGCSVCLVTNLAEAIRCVACETPKPGSEPKPPASGFSFGGPPVAGGGFAALFKPKTTKCDKCKDAVVNAIGELCAACKIAPVSETIVASKPQPNVFGNIQGDALSKLQTDGSKNEFGGFTFISTPVIKPGSEASKESSKSTPPSNKTSITPSKLDRITATAVSKQKDALSSAEKPFQSPFASFQFTSKTTAAESISINNAITPVITSKDKMEPVSLFGQLSSTPNLSFDKISSNTPSGFKSDPNFKGFPGSGQPLFTSPDASSPKNTSKDGADDFVPSAEFKPVVPLPELIVVKTGEEDEEKLFVERAKLYRFVPEQKEWKERGIGDIKILKHPETSICRILMRRDQVLKICANHRIFPEMKLTPMSSSDKAWVWFAQDYSEGELRQEQFAIKFKNKDIALKFKQVFEECQATPIKELPSVSTEKTDNTSKLDAFNPVVGSWKCPGCLTFQEASSKTCPACGTQKSVSSYSKPAQKPSVAQSLAEMFKPEEGSWKCDTCYVQNKPSTNICIACATPNKNMTSTVSSSSPLPSFSFLTAAGNTKFTSSPIFNFSSSDKSAAALGSNSSGFTFPNQTEKSKTSSNSSFIVGNLDGKLDESKSTLTSEIFQSSNFGKAGTPSRLPGHTTPPPVPTEFKFGSPQKFEFHFSGVRPKSPTKTPKSPGTPSDSAKDGTEDEAETSDGEIFFQPVIPLPPKVDVKTGEEGEEVLYCHRAKLYRLDHGEWKERGTGDVKLLKDLDTKKIRILMRREQVLKVCLNHLLPDDLELQEKGDRTWFWSAVDYADGMPQPEQLALRFKNHEVAEGFKTAVEKAKAFLRNIHSDSEESKPKGEPENTSLKQKEQESISNITSKGPETPNLESSIPTVFGFAAKPSTALSAGSFIFGNQQNNTLSSPPGSFIFGGSSLKDTGFGTSMTAPKQSTQSGQEVLVLEEKKSPDEKQNMAQSLQLPVNFYRYEEKDPCLGCRGCADEQQANKKDGDLELVFVEEATEEEKEKARQLLLPDSFYLYKRKTPCPGCRGCTEEESPIKSSEVDLSLQQDETKSKSKSPEKQLLAPQSSSETHEKSVTPMFSTNSSNTRIFSTPDVPEFSFAKLASQKDENGFAALAAGSKDGNAFKQTTNFEGFTGAGTQVFAKQQPTVSSPKENGENSDEVAPSVDVHFDPLVPLPELVDVKTGEEDEESIFSQRARLYRFDSGTKQWKERGTGEMKILKHNTKCQFRLLLRRDQVLKIACNHLISPSLELKPMNNANNSLVWSALDFSEGVQVAETFAIKFKNQELLMDFQQKVEECQAILIKDENTETDRSSKNENSSDQVDEDKASQEGDPDVQNQASPGSEDQEHSYYSEEAEYEDEEDEEDDDLEQLMFEKRITLSEAPLGSKDYKVLGIGTLRVLYDDEVFGCRIQVADDSTKLLCDHIVAVQTCLRVVDKEATWAVVDMAVPTPTRRQFKAIFSSLDAAQEFQRTFDEAKQLAVTSEIVENEDPTPNFS